MKKPWLLWVGVLVVIVVIVFVATRRKTTVTTERTVSTPTTTGTLKRNVRYDMVAKDVLAHADAGSGEDLEVGGGKGLGFLLQQYLGFSVFGEGWVASVEPVEGGGWTVTIDVDAPGGKSDGPEVTAFVPAANAKGESPAVGAKVDFKGRVGGLQVEGGRLLMEIKAGTVTPAASTPAK